MIEIRQFVVTVRVNSTTFANSYAMTIDEAIEKITADATAWMTETMSTLNQSPKWDEVDGAWSFRARPRPLPATR
jgi:hypothetical protein